MGTKQHVLIKEGNFFELLPMRDDNYGNGCQKLQYILSELLCVRYLNFSNERGEQVEQNVRGFVGWILFIYLFIHSLIHSSLCNDVSCSDNMSTATKCNIKASNEFDQRKMNGRDVTGGTSDIYVVLTTETKKPIRTVSRPRFQLDTSLVKNQKRYLYSMRHNLGFARRNAEKFQKSFGSRHEAISKKCYPCVIPGFRREVDENCALLYYSSQLLPIC